MSEFDSGLGDIFGGQEWASPMSFQDVASSLSYPSASPAGGGSSWLGDMWGGVKSGASDMWGGVEKGAKAFQEGASTVLSPFGKVADALSPIMKVGAPIAGIVAQQQANSQLGRQNKIAERASRTQERAAEAGMAAAAPLTEFGSDALHRAERGEISPAVQAMIDNWKSGARAQMHQYLAHIGQGDSQTLAQMDAYIDQQALGMAAKYLGQEEQTGIQALSGGANALTGAGGVAGGVQQRAGASAGDLEKLIASANQQMAQLTGASG